MTDVAAVPQAVPARLAQVAWLGGTYAASNVTRAALGFLSSIIIARGLGPDRFGSWALWTAWAAVLTMAFDGGFGVLVTRDVARDGAQAGRLVAAAVVIRLLAFTPVALALWGVAPTFSSGASRSAVPLILGLAAAGLAYGGIASGFKAWPAWVPAILTIEIAGTALNCVGAASVVWYHLDVRVLLAVAFAVQGLQIVAALILWQRVVGLHALVVPGYRDALTLIGRAWPFALSGLIANGQARLGPLMLGALSTTGQVALFGVASRIVEGVKMLPQAALAGVLPVLSADAADGAEVNVRRAFHRRLRVFVWVSAASLLVFAYPLIRLTYGSRYIDAWTALAVLAIGLPATVVNSARKVYLYASGREADATWWSGASLVIQTVAAAALVPAWGAVGAGLALAVGEGAVARALSRAGGR